MEGKSIDPDTANYLAQYFAAYTAVAARRGFDAPPPPPPPPPPPSKQSQPFSEAVRQYVSRTFDDQYSVPGISSEELTNKLRDVINEQAQRVGIGNTDWANMALPQHYILQERARDKIQHAPYLPVNTDPQSSKKRKSMDFEPMDATPSAPVWTPPSRTAFEDRLSFPAQSESNAKQKKQKLFQDDVEAFKTQGGANGDLAKRRARFGEKALAEISSGPAPEADAIPQGPVIGTCQTLEKRYFRLTAPPKAETVRPKLILRQTLALLKDKWKTEHNYNYICDQFKSLRQDLTVQHIKDEFTVEVYEVHARIALDKGDLGEYNQCQTQLRALYRQQLGGNPGEFLAYRILYFVYTSSRADLNTMLAGLMPEERAMPAVKHALQVRAAVALGNYHRFFRLYAEAPNMGANLMEMCLIRERLIALAKICRV